MIIVLDNECGLPTYWFIPYPTTSLIGAKREAWRAYRGLAYKDNEFPPKWTHARLLDHATFVAPVQR